MSQDQYTFLKPDSYACFNRNFIPTSFFLFFFETSFIICCNSFPPIIILFRINFVFQRNIFNVIIIFISFLHSFRIHIKISIQLQFKLKTEMKKKKKTFSFWLSIILCYFFHGESFKMYIVYPIRAKMEITPSADADKINCIFFPWWSLIAHCSTLTG